jgi:uncharacterized repeat protein (TIGR03843 family)
MATEEILGVLAGGEVELKGRLPWSSNATFLAAVQPASSDSDESPPMLAIYKPARGERPLWDFPGGLWRREVAAYELDAFLGWGIVPPTVAREDAPLGPGSLQYCVDALFEEHYFTLVSSPEHHRDLRRIAAFDLVVNNADRKAGHCLLDQEGRIWAIDNGLSFHVEPKLRTVIWDFAGERIDAGLLDSLAPLAAGDVPVAVTDLLAADELAALVARAGRAQRKGKYPAPTGEFPYPWPLI